MPELGTVLPDSVLCNPFGSKAVEAAVKAIPAVIMNGLTVCGNLLPAVGMAMLLKLLWNNKICVYFSWDLCWWLI